MSSNNGDKPQMEFTDISRAETPLGNMIIVQTGDESTLVLDVTEKYEIILKGLKGRKHAERAAEALLAFAYEIIYLEDNEPPLKKEMC